MTGINDQGDVVGMLLLTAREGLHGFLLSKGKFTTIDVPGSDGTEARGINALGGIAGEFMSLQA